MKKHNISIGFYDSWFSVRDWEFNLLPTIKISSIKYTLRPYKQVITLELKWLLWNVEISAER